MLKEKTLIITNCTNRKRLEPPPECSIGQYDPGNVDELAGRWLTQLAKVDKKTSAEWLYCGRVFAEVKSATTLLNAKLLVASAGLGLIEASNEVPTYSSTISKGNGDYVLDKLIEGSVSDWWDALNRKSPFSVALNTRPYELVLIAMSYPYFKLIQNQLIALNDTEKSKLRLFLRVNRSDVSSCLLPYLMPYDERFDGQEGPNRGTLNDFPQRALRHFAESILPISSINSSEIHTFLVEEVLKELQPHKNVAGVRFSDEEMTCLIQEQWSESFTSPTKMLRFFRDSLGIACEQKRFQRLFHNVAKLMETR
ncbi:hypothetical protein U737_15130 [Methylomonas sp. LW13]|uniref:hypothetical protein n=1 Tax=unclassified Methylomonas TaxID=2608980 RepID=UPI00051BD4D1|nr:hypothetical protein [Methylomonas sp. LW13]QBC28121.1 hypothetical protein U737_15130 [Methylomonas sp. LW13]